MVVSTLNQRVKIIDYQIDYPKKGMIDITVELDDKVIYHGNLNPCAEGCNNMNNVECYGDYGNPIDGAIPCYECHLRGSCFDKTFGEK
jgi:hypothetical protein